MTLCLFSDGYSLVQVGDIDFFRQCGDTRAAFKEIFRHCRQRPDDDLKETSQSGLPYIHPDDLRLSEDSETE
jgi:hypothetical protein